MTPTLAGLWALRSHWKRLDDRRAIRQGLRRLRTWYTQTVLPWGLDHGKLVAAFCAGTFVFALALVPSGVVGEEFIPPADRGEIYVQVIYPIGTPIQTVAQARSRSSRIDSQHARHVCQHCGRRRLRGIVRRLRDPEQRRPSPHLAQRRAEGVDELLGAAVPANRRQDVAATAFRASSCRPPRQPAATRSRSTCSSPT